MFFTWVSPQYVMRGYRSKAHYNCIGREEAGSGNEVARLWCPAWNAAAMLHLVGAAVIASSLDSRIVVTVQLSARVC